MEKDTKILTGDDITRWQYEGYQSDLEELSAFMQSRHYIGKVKHIGLREACQAAMEYIREIEGAALVKRLGQEGGANLG